MIAIARGTVPFVRRGPISASAVSFHSFGKGPIGLILSGLGVLATVAGFLYNVYIFFDLFSVFGQQPFGYGVFWRFVSALVAGSAITTLVVRTATAFLVDDDESEKDSDKASELVSYIWLFGAIAVVSSPFILYSNWGSLLHGFGLGAYYFAQWKFHYLLAGVLGISFAIHLFQRLLGYDDEEGWDYRILSALAAVFIAPIAEEVLFRWVFFNLSNWWWTSFLGFTQPFTYVLPLFGYTIGWGVPLGLLLAISANADGFYKAHGGGKWFHHWIMGVIASYAYFASGTLLVPIAIHLIWNGLTSLYDLVVNAKFPLQGATIASARKGIAIDRSEADSTHASFPVKSPVDAAIQN